TRGHRSRRRVPRRASSPGDPPPRPHTAAGQVPAAKPLQADARAGARDPCPLGGRRRHPGAARRGIRRPPQAPAAHRPRARLEGGGMTNVAPRHTQLGQPAEDVAEEAPDDLVLWSVTTIIGVLDKPALLYWAAE